MNLFYDPSISALRELVDSSNKSLKVHNVVIDFDGEVIIDPEVKYEGIELSRFKFHTKISQSIKKNAKGMKALFETLLDAYNRGEQAVEMHRMNRAA
jgi:hypothetical protein